MKDSSSGIQFAKVRELGGESQRCIGIGQVKKSFTPAFFLGMFSTNEYAVAMYVNAQVAAKELSLRQRGGLALQSEDDLCVGLLDGAFTKSLHVVFAREMLGDEFVEMLHGVLAPRMRLMESTADLKTFSEMFKNKEFTKGMGVELVWKVNGMMEVSIHEKLDRVTKKTIESQALCRGLFEAFLGENTVSPTTKASVGKGAAMLLDSDKTNRSWLKRSILTEKASYDEGRKPSWHLHSVDEPPL